MHALRFATLAALLTIFVAGCPAPPAASNPTRKRDGGTSKDGFDPSAACGGPSDSCCPGDTCDPALPLECNTAKGTCCGKSTLGCDSVADCCNGLACSDGRCCAALQASCKTSNDCCSGLACVNGSCDKQSGSCGGANQACCPGSACSSGNVCAGGMCKTCGAAGQPCCTGSTCTSKSVSCNTTTMTCETPCGSANQACCKVAPFCSPATLTCTTGKVCSDGTTGTTGGLNQPCNPGNTCNNGLSCINASCIPTPTCTTVGATCCTGGTCQGAGLTCGADNKCVAAAACGALSTACSTQSQCCTGFQCILTANPDVDNSRKQCCVGANTACTDDFDCCGFLTCVNSQCTQQPDGEYCLTNGDCLNANCNTTTHLCDPDSGMCTGGLPVGPTSVCSNDDQCCGTASCAPMQSTGGAKRCCMAGTNPCTTNSDCCGTMVCGANKTCTCHNANESCLSDVDCCSNLTCGANGKCSAGGGAGTVNPGGACTDGNQCKEANGAVYACPNDRFMCCTYHQSTPCNGSAECCDDYVCDQNTPDGSGPTVCCGPTGAVCRPGFPYDCCGDLLCDVTGHCNR